MKHVTADESQSSHYHHHEPWWKSKYVIYDTVMHILVVTSNVATFVYVRHHKIPIAASKSDMIWLVAMYCLSVIFGVIYWVAIFKKKPAKQFLGGAVDRLGHLYGLVFLIILFHSISPVFALYFGIVSSFWFVFAYLYTMCRLCHSFCTGL